MNNADINSPTYIIRDKFVDRLKAVPTFKSVKLFSYNPMKGPVQPENLPYLGCYVIEERFTEDGQGNHGQPRFACAARLGFSIQVVSNDNKVAQDNLDAAGWTIMRLFENQAWWDYGVCDGEFMKITDYRGRVIQQHLKIEAVTGGNRRFNFGPPGQQHETSWAELQMDLTFTHRIEFPPYVPDHLDLMHITVAYPWPYDPNEREPFTVVYDLTSDDGLPSGPVVPPDWGPQPPP
jgi:hypothetical protein